MNLPSHIAEGTFQQQQEYFAAHGIAVDAFGEPIDEAAYVSAPAVSIPITDELRAADAARKVPEDHPWQAVKAGLSADALKRTRPRAAERGVTTGPKRHCTGDGCFNVLPHGNKGGVCADCIRKINAARRWTTCTNCPTPIELRVKSGLCVACRTLAKAAKPKLKETTLRPVATSEVRDVLGVLAVAKLAIDIGTKLHKSHTTNPTLERETMSTTIHCEGGCGKALSDADLSKGKTFAWGHANGCPKTKKATKATKPTTMQRAKDIVDKVAPKPLALLRSVSDAPPLTYQRAPRPRLADRAGASARCAVGAAPHRRQGTAHLRRDGARVQPGRRVA